MKKIILLSLIIVCLFLAGLFLTKRIQQSSRDNPGVNPGVKNIYQCKTNDDCVLISIGDCCNFTSVNKKYSDEIKAVFMTCDQYCPSKAVCKDNNCKVK